MIVLGSLEMGGAERQALLLGHWLADHMGARAEIWGFSPPGKAAQICTELGLPWRSLPFPWGSGKRNKLRGVRSFWQALRHARPDIVLPYTVLPNIICGITWQLSGVRLCLWNQVDAGEPTYSFRMQRLAVRLTSSFIANSPSGIDYLRQALQVDPDKIHLIPNGIGLPAPLQDRENWRQQMAVGSQDFVACMVANLRYPKDHHTLVQAWRMVVDQVGPEARLVFAGKLMEAYPDIKALVQQLNLEKQVLFLGQVDDIAGLLDACDLCVFSSLSEGSPNALMECMAGGLAVVATDLPGIRMVLDHFDSPFLAPPEDAPGMAQHILRLYADPALRAQQGQANRQRINTDFSLDRMCRTTTQLLDDLLSRSGRKGT